MEGRTIKGAAFRFMAGLLLLQAPATALAAVNDVFPSDYFPLPEGTVSYALYAYHRVYQGPYAQGVKTGAAEMTSEVLALRLAKMFKVKGISVSPIGVLNWSSTSIGPSAWASAMGGHAAGLGDARLGGALWLHEDREAGRFLAVTGMVIAPTGDYDGKRLLNIGENRWRYVLSGGFITPLSQDFILDLIPEAAWYDANDDYAGGKRLEQDPSYALTGYVRYRAAPQLQLHVGGQWNGGGETSINGVAQNNPPENQRLMVGASHLTADKNQWILRFGSDIDAENGFPMRGEVALRFMSRF